MTRTPETSYVKEGHKDTYLEGERERQTDTTDRQIGQTRQRDRQIESDRTKDTD